MDEPLCMNNTCGGTTHRHANVILWPILAFSLSFGKMFFVDFQFRPLVLQRLPRHLKKLHCILIEGEGVCFVEVSQCNVCNRSGFEARESMIKLDNLISDGETRSSGIQSQYKNDILPGEFVQTHLFFLGLGNFIRLLILTVSSGKPALNLKTPYPLYDYNYYK